MPNEQLYLPRTISAHTLGDQVDHITPEASDRDQEAYRFPDPDGYKRVVGAVVVRTMNE